MIRLLFLELLNRSVAASWLILTVILIRLLLRRLPRWAFCLMWGVVGVRLVLPFLFESTLSLIPSTKTIVPSIDLGRMVVQTGIESIDAPVNMFLDGQFDTALVAPKVLFDTVMGISSTVWIIGAISLLLYTAITDLRLRRKVAASLHMGSNVYLCDEIDSPFVLGIFQPKIFLPSDMDRTQVDSVLRHERAHIARRDPLWKIVGFVLLSVFWFNPLLWVAYILFGRDIELACDERVLKDMGTLEKKKYAEALLYCGVHRKRFAASPVAFGEVGVKRRIRSIVHFKGLTQKSTAAALVVCVLLVVSFLTSPTEPLKEYNFSNGFLSFGSGPCNCKAGKLEQCEYFHAQDGDIYTACIFKSWNSCHVHEYGTMMTVTYCPECGAVYYAEPMFSGLRCCSTEGGIIRD